MRAGAGAPPRQQSPRISKADKNAAKDKNGLESIADPADQADKRRRPQTRNRKRSKKLAPDIQAEALWDGREPGPFHALDNPKMVTAPKPTFWTTKNTCWA